VKGENPAKRILTVNSVVYVAARCGPASVKTGPKKKMSGDITINLMNSYIVN
jgi:hypothetical protein